MYVRYPLLVVVSQSHICLADIRISSRNHGHVAQQGSIGQIIHSVSIAGLCSREVPRHIHRTCSMCLGYSSGVCVREREWQLHMDDGLLVDDGAGGRCDETILGFIFTNSFWQVIVWLCKNYVYSEFPVF